MKLVLLSGGSGTRLWPLSNKEQPKQFIKILKNNNGEYESMFQRILRQVREAGLSEDTYISTVKNQVELIKSQSIGKGIPLIIEPEARDTFPAILLAASYIYQDVNMSRDDIVCTCPVDLYTDSTFFKYLNEVEYTLKNSRYDLALIGVEPTYPAEKYGYILPEIQEEEGIINVKQFVEKPKKEIAEELIDKKALWNGGVFCFKLGLVMDILQSRNYTIEFEELLKQYHQLPKNSFDYEVVENLENAIVFPYQGDWDDMGTWDILTRKMEETIVGTGVLCDDSTNTHIINCVDTPILGMGLSDIVVVATKDGILVSKKSVSSFLKAYYNGSCAIQNEKLARGT